ncbi:MAG: hypothetical protein VYE73_14650 [Acidobacteriota bacterium]|nr:hypothetical protein [Acidobacteriota bacterium]
MAAHETALNATSTPWAPWYAVPADDKPCMRETVANIIRDTLIGLDLGYPVIADGQRAAFDEMRPLLRRDD